MKKASVLVVGLISWAMVSSCIASAPVGTAGTVHGIALAGIPDEIQNATARLDQLIDTLQQVPDISDPAMAGLVASLNEAMAMITNASIAYSTGDNVTANATIVEASALLDGLKPEINDIIARHFNQKAMEAGMIVFGIILAVVIVACLIFVKRWHDKRTLDSFLATEIDYPSST